MTTKQILKIIERSNVYKPRFNYIMKAVLEKFQRDNDDMAIMGVHQKVGELLDEINAL